MSTTVAATMWKSRKTEVMAENMNHGVSGGLLTPESQCYGSELLGRFALGVGMIGPHFLSTCDRNEQIIY